MNRALHYDDVALIPRYFDGTSRSLISTNMTLGNKTFRLPVIPANMKCVIDESIAEKLQKNNWYVPNNKKVTIKRLLYAPIYRVKSDFLNKSYKFKNRSNIALDIVIPAIDKDSDVLPITIRNAKKYIQHPIKNIFIVLKELVFLAKVLVKQELFM